MHHVRAQIEDLYQELRSRPVLENDQSKTDLDQLSLKANKQTVASALQRKANKVDVENGLL